jgi:methylamine--corrinoid protein Co-methyltransferase
MHTRFLENWKKAETGPVLEEKAFNLERYWPSLKRITEKYGIKYDPENLIPTDNDLLDRLFEAAAELLAEVGVYCITSQRVIEFSREEIEEALCLLPKQVTVGEGKDSVTFKPRKLEPTDPPIVLGRVLGPQSDDILDKIYLSFVQEPLLDIVHLQGTYPFFQGLPVKSGSPLELLMEIDRITRIRNVLRKVGRPGLHEGGTGFPSVNSVLFAGNPEWGIRHGDGRHALILPQLKTEYDELNRALAGMQNGFHISGAGIAYLGGLSGGPSHSAVTILAELIASVLLYQPSMLHSGAMDIRANNTSGNRPAFWTKVSAGAAFIKKTGFGAVRMMGKLSAGPCCKEFFWEIAANAIAAAVCGFTINTGTGWMSAKYDGSVGIACRFAGEIGRAATGLGRAKANTLINKIIPKYEEKIANKTISILGKSFRECYDTEKVAPTPEHLMIYNSVKEEILKLELNS